MRRKLRKSRDSVSIGGLGRQSLGGTAWPGPCSLLPAPHTTQMSDTPHTQSTTGDPRCRQADFRNKLLHTVIGMDVTKGAWGREIALTPLFSALLYYLMPSNMSVRTGIYPGVGPQKHSSLVYRPGLRNMSGIMPLDDSLGQF